MSVNSSEVNARAKRTSSVVSAKLAKQASTDSPTASLAIVHRLPFARNAPENVFVHQGSPARNAINVSLTLSVSIRSLVAKKYVKLPNTNFQLKFTLSLNISV